MTSYPYEIIVSWSSEDEVFIADVPDLPGCVAYGDTTEAAISNATHAIRLWLEATREMGGLSDKPEEDI